MLQLRENLLEEEFMMPIRRGHVLEDALRNMQRSSFLPGLQLNVSMFIIFYCILASLIIIQVEFLGEEAEDGGGPKREFWSLIAKDIRETFEGPVNRKIPLHDVIGLQVRM